MQDARPTPPTFRELFPELPEDSLADAEANFVAYLTSTLRLFDRLESTPEGRAYLDSLTFASPPSTMGGKVDSPWEGNTNDT